MAVVPGLTLVVRLLLTAALNPLGWPIQEELFIMAGALLAAHGTPLPYAPLVPLPLVPILLYQVRTFLTNHHCRREA